MPHATLRAIRVNRLGVAETANMTTDERLIDLEQRVIPQLLQRIGALEDISNDHSQIVKKPKCSDPVTN